MKPKNRKHLENIIRLYFDECGVLEAESDFIPMINDAGLPISDELRNEINNDFIDSRAEMPWMSNR